MNDRTPTSFPPRVEVQTETESPRGWTYHVLVHRAGPSVSTHTVTLAWCDHDHWSGGRSAPSRVVQAVVEYAITHAEQDLPPKFDASTVRRWNPKLDSELRELL